MRFSLAALAVFCLAADAFNIDNVSSDGQKLGVKNWRIPNKQARLLNQLSSQLSRQELMAIIKQQAGGTSGNTFGHVHKQTADAEPKEASKLSERDLMEMDLIEFVRREAEAEAEADLEEFVRREAEAEAEPEEFDDLDYLAEFLY